jgi:NAD(P)-dependent dehydrogenase (short-subunit alcohol dehydrogenase family)
MGLLDDKVVVVTGGASGIGAACAKTPAREGARVVVTDIDDRGGDETVKTITGAGGRAVYLHQDVTVEQHWVEIVEEIENRYRRLDVLISNAGISIGAQSIVEMTLSDWRRQTAINLDGVFLSVKHCLPPMRRSGGGSIVLMSSVAGLRGSPTLAGYCATKGGVRVFAKAVAMECAGANDGILPRTVILPALPPAFVSKASMFSGSVSRKLRRASGRPVEGSYTRRTCLQALQTVKMPPQLQSLFSPSAKPRPLLRRSSHRWKAKTGGCRLEKLENSLPT